MIQLHFSTPRSTVALITDAYRNRMGAAELADLAQMLHSIMPIGHKGGLVTQDDINLAKAMPVIQHLYEQLNAPVVLTRGRALTKSTHTGVYDAFNFMRANR